MEFCNSIDEDELVLLCWYPPTFTVNSYSYLNRSWVVSMQYFQSPIYFFSRSFSYFLSVNKQRSMILILFLIFIDMVVNHIYIFCNSQVINNVHRYIPNNWYRFYQPSSDIFKTNTCFLKMMHLVFRKNSAHKVCDCMNDA